MTTELTGPMDSEMIEEVSKALQRFIGKEVRVTIEVSNGEKPKRRTT
jgi:hypothetical protein